VTRYALALGTAFVVSLTTSVVVRGERFGDRPFHDSLPSSAGSDVAHSYAAETGAGGGAWHPGQFPLTIIDERRGELFQFAEYAPRIVGPGELIVRGQSPADLPPTFASDQADAASALIPATAFFGYSSGAESLVEEDANRAWEMQDYDSPSIDNRHTVRRTDADDVWRFVLLPEDLIYRSYLAGAKESRFGTQIMWDNDDLNPNTFLWEATLGARVGILRFGSVDRLYPQGFQVDVEGSAQVRLDILEDVDVRSVDFRGGIPLTYGVGRWQFKTGYYHLSSHLGDEFVIKNPTYNRLNFARDVFILGASYHLTDDLRVYGEVGYAFYRIVSEHWETQFGFDFAPARPTGFAGAPYVAANVHLREELDYSGNFEAQVGWAWRSDRGRKLLRLGVTYYNGLSPQNSFYQRHEQQIGIGAYYDF
jgi:hypothetical protein